MENNKDQVKVLVSLNEVTHEEVTTYNQLLEYLANEKETETLWKFKRSNVLLHTKDHSSQLIHQLIMVQCIIS